MKNKDFYRFVGVGVVLSALAALLYDPRIGWLTVFLGVHIVQHTYTGFCLLQKVLNKGSTQQ
jgi:hypothetical protein